MKKIITLLLLVVYLVQAESLDQQVKRLDQQIKVLKALVHPSFKIQNNKIQDKLSIGGYGELHYNIKRSGKIPSGRKNSGKKYSGDDKIDFHRYVLFFNYKYNKDIKLFSEFELEHSLVTENGPGEVELEQAFIEIKLNEGLYVKSGVFLIPIGILNETHEPPTFYGVERNPVEKTIIPATWWEAGVSLIKQYDNGLTLDWALHSALSLNDNFIIRKGRQKVAKANANEWATTFRAKYNKKGLELATSLQYQNDISTNAAKNSAFLYSAHAIYQVNNFKLKTLYARWNINNVEKAGEFGEDSKNQNGFYIEPSYKITDKLGLFVHYFKIDSEESDQNGFVFGANYYPINQVVFKIDYLIEKDGDQKESLNLALGYQF